jgi:hypothetical protein
MPACDVTIVRALLLLPWNGIPCVAEVAAMILSWGSWIAIGLGAVVIGVVLKRAFADYLLDHFG